MFCDGSARAIVAMLLAECAQGGVDLRVGHTVTDISACRRLPRRRPPGGCFTASALVLATGGLSIPKMGATGFAYDVARRFGLRIVEPLPGLVPLTATPEALGLRPGFSPAFPGSDRILRGNELSRKHSVHAPRPLRSGDPANLLLLAAGRYDQPSIWRRITTRAPFCWSASSRGPGRKPKDRARRDPACAPRAGAGRGLLAARADGQYPRPHARSVCGAPQALGGSTRRARRAGPRPR